MREEVLVTTCARIFRRREENNAGGVSIGVIAIIALIKAL